MTEQSPLDLDASALLCGDRFAPLTSEIGFLNTDLSTAVDVFIQWSKKILRDVMNDTRGEIRQKAITGKLCDLIPALLPLRSIRPSRYAFIPTRSNWVAYLDNSSRGTDAFPVVSHLAETIGCRGLRVVAIPHTINVDAKNGRYGALMLEVYGAQPTSGELNVERSVGVVNDGGRWVFDEQGEVFPFEDTDRYKKRAVTERFTFVTLKAYCEALGLSVFDETFYRDQATIVESASKLPKNARDFSLEEVRLYMGLPTK
jgi:hypothetical protein